MNLFQFFMHTIGNRIHLTTVYRLQIFISHLNLDRIVDQCGPIFHYVCVYIHT